MPRKLPEHVAFQLLSKFGIPVAPYVFVDDCEHVVRKALEHGLKPPLAVKVSSARIIHKSDVGGVVLGVQSLKDAARACQEIVERVRSRLGFAPEGIVVQEMVNGYEVFVGGIRDPSFGPVVVVGVGGVYVELYGDVSFKMVPVSRSDVLQAIRETRLWRLLSGFRGPRGDIDALIDVVVGVARLLDERSDVLEVDLNPVIVLEEGRGAVVVDARVVVGDESRQAV